MEIRKWCSRCEHIYTIGCKWWDRHSAVGPVLCAFCNSKLVPLPLRAFMQEAIANKRCKEKVVNIME